MVNGTLQGEYAQQRTQGHATTPLHKALAVLLCEDTEEEFRFHTKQYSALF